MDSNFRQDKKRDKKLCDELKVLKGNIEGMRWRIRYYQRKFLDAERRALKDPITCLPNSAALEMKFAEEYSKLSRFKTSNTYLIFLDVDDFKRFNDQYGQNTGDDILRKVASVIQKNIRPYDSVFRKGGDEFVILVPEVRSVRSAFSVAERIRKTIAGTPIIPYNTKDTVSVTVSIGITPLEENKNHIEKRANEKEFEKALQELIYMANLAEKEAKESGKNRTYMFLDGKIIKNPKETENKTD